MSYIVNYEDNMGNDTKKDFIPHMQRRKPSRTNWSCARNTKPISNTNVLEIVPYFRFRERSWV